ncbi:MAG: hypothetical protein RL701_7518, partial [Pseudomonadota bacterium]
MSTSDGPNAAALPKSPELHGIDAQRLTAPAQGNGFNGTWPSTAEVAAWANEFFKAGGLPSSGTPELPSTPGTVSGAALPDPATLGRRAPGELPAQPPILPLVTSFALPTQIVADPHLGQTLDYRPEVLQSTFVGAPSMGGIDPINRGTLTPQPQARGREALARLDPVAPASTPYYFMNQNPQQQRPDTTAIDLQKIQSFGADWSEPTRGSGRGYETTSYPHHVDPRSAQTPDPSNGWGALPNAGTQVPTVTPQGGQGAPAWSLARQNDESITEPMRARQFEVASIRADFPILTERVNGKPLVWLDNAATTQKPQAVIDRLSFFYAHENSNVHRAAHTLAARSSDAYEDARESVRHFLNAGSTDEIVFVRGTTEGINLIANSWGGRYIEAGDEIIVTRIEHHSNIVPWQMLCARTGAKLRVAEVDDTGQVILEQYERLFNSHTRLVSFTHVSNALGTILPVREMTEIAHRHGARVVIDGAQSVCHLRVDVQSLNPDFYVFSGHKVFGPTGIGAVYGKKSLLNAMPPWQGGGAMIRDVTFEKSDFNPPPQRFEAGTGNIADAVGLGTALQYLESLGMDNVTRHEHDLLEYGTSKLREVPGLKFVGTAKEKAAVLGFVLENMPTEQVGAALSAAGIAVRAGHHCAQPALRRFGYEATVRPSLAVYNNRSDIDALVATLHELQ